MRAHHTGAALSSRHKMSLLACMYFCQSIPMGYIFCLLPVIMREEGVSLAYIGSIFLLRIPWALKFLYASWIDRLYLPALGRRRSWIFPLQWGAACLLLLAAYTPPHVALQPMFIVLLLFNIIMATNDIAVDGYATDILEDREMAWGNTIQAGARYVGMFFGGGMMLTLYRSFGWQSLCMILAGVVFVLSLPVVLHREVQPVPRNIEPDNDRPGVMAFVRRRDILWLIPVLIAPTAFAFCAYQLRTSLFVDLGLGSPLLGRFMMQYAVPLGAMGTISTAWVVNRWGCRVFIRFFCTLCILLAAYAAHFAIRGTITMLEAGIMLCVDNMLIGGVNVWGFTLMMRASVGKHAGTGFAVLSSLFMLVPLGVTPLMGKLGDVYGFANLYSMLVVCMVAGLFVAEFFLRLSPGRLFAPSQILTEAFRIEYQGEWNDTTQQTKRAF